MVKQLLRRGTLSHIPLKAPLQKITAKLRGRLRNSRNAIGWPDVEHGGVDVVKVLPPRWLAFVQHLHHRTPNGPDIRLGAIHLWSNNLWCHSKRRPNQRPTPTLARIGNISEWLTTPKVCQLGYPVAINENILSFDVTMHDSLAV